ncbi:MAG: acetolactate synthase small subunit [Cyanobacteria bacterium]|nr:acetolactate synthase small subunit [Cyanobacteriota bacterium]
MDIEFELQYECILSLLIENQLGILTRIASIINRRNFQVDSIAIGSCEYSNMIRMVIVLPGNLNYIDQVSRQLYKIYAIAKVQNLSRLPALYRELVLFKILINTKDRKEIFEVIKIFKANIIDCTNAIITIELAGDSEKIAAFEQMIHKFTILEKVRTGKIGVSLESVLAGQLYTPQRKRQRQYLVKPQTYEIETRMYLEELKRKEEEALRAKAEQQNEEEENETKTEIKKYLIGNGGT